MESVARAPRFRWAAPDALLGFPVIWSHEVRGPRPAFLPTLARRSVPVGRRRLASRVPPEGFTRMTGLVETRPSRLTRRRDRSRRPSSSVRPTTEKDSATMASRRTALPCLPRSTAGATMSPCWSRSSARVVGVRSRPRRTPRDRPRRDPGPSRRTFRLRPGRPRVGARRDRSHVGDANEPLSPARFASPPARPPSCNRTCDAARPVHVVPSARMT